VKLECVRVQFVKGKQHYQILREIMYIPIRTVGKLKLNQPILVLLLMCLSDSVLSLLQNSTPCGQIAGGDRAPR